MPIVDVRLEIQHQPSAKLNQSSSLNSDTSGV